MTPENKTKVLEALRSGRYKQYRCGIANESSPWVSPGPTAFCCIGAMDVELNGKLAIRQLDRYFNTDASIQAVGLTDIKFSKKAYEYLVERTPAERNEYFHPDEPLSSVLISLNDTFLWDFNQIADFLEVALEEV